MHPVRDCRGTSFLATTALGLGIEDLNVKGMLKNHKLARAISDMGFYEFRRQLEYKANWRGGIVVIADRFFPSSKLCSDCGHKVEKMHVVILFNLLTIWAIAIITRILATETKKLEMFFNTLPLFKSFWIFRHCGLSFIISLIILLPSFVYTYNSDLMGPIMWISFYIEIILLNIIIYMLNYHNVKNVTLIAFIIFLVCYFLQFMLVGF